MICALCRRRFPWNRRHFSSQRRVDSVESRGGIVKTLRHLSCSVFSTAGSFGLNRFADLRGSLDCRESPDGSRIEPSFFANCVLKFGALKHRESQVGGDSRESLARL